MSKDYYVEMIKNKCLGPLYFVQKLDARGRITVGQTIREVLEIECGGKDLLEIDISKIQPKLASLDSGLKYSEEIKQTYSLDKRGRLTIDMDIRKLLGIEMGDVVQGKVVAAYKHICKDMRKIDEFNLF